MTRPKRVGAAVPVTAVVFDIGGVLVDWNPRYLYRKLLDEPSMQHFLAEVCTLEWHRAHDRGVLMADTAADLCTRHPDQAHLIDAWRLRWAEMYGGPISGTVELLELLAARLPVHGLTNWPAERFDEAVAMFPFLALLNPTVVSGREGVAKPDPALFHILIDRTGLEPTATLYIDDAPANITTASALGFRVHRFNGADGLRTELEAHGLV